MIKKKFALLFSLSMFIFSGCVVQSLNPFYVQDAAVKLPELSGSWYLVKSGSDDSSVDYKTPWALDDDGKFRTFDEKGNSGVLEVRFFKVDDIVFMDLCAGDIEESKVNFWWAMHVVPVHTLCRVKADKDQMELVPLDYNWLQDQLKEGKVKLPFLKADSEDIFIFSASSSQWMALLKELKDNKEAFPSEKAYIFKRTKASPS
jgi:hypothetical protein